MHADDLPIPEPCTADWDAMRVLDTTRRHCGQCDKAVHDLSAMSDADARALLASDRVCVRYRTATDGRIVHRPPIRQALRRTSSVALRMPRVVRGLATAVGLVGVATPAFAGSSVDDEGWFGWAVATVVELAQGLFVEEEVVMGEVAYEPPPVDTGRPTRPVKGRPKVERPPEVMGVLPPRPTPPAEPAAVR